MPLANAPWMDRTLSGVFVLRNVDGPAFERIARQAAGAYRGPDFGGLDLMVPGDRREAWLLIGRWTDAWTDDVGVATKALHERLSAAVDLENAGVRLAPGGSATIDVGHAFDVIEGRPKIDVTPLYAYRASLHVPWWLPEKRAELEAAYPRLPGFLGLHMRAPHWLGRGLSREGDRILSVTPYVRIDLVAERGIAIQAMAEEASIAPWIEALRRELAV